MDTSSSYQAAAQAYANGVRLLFAPAGVAADERGERGPAAPQQLADRAEQLTTLSDNLTLAATARLASPGLGRAYRGIDSAAGQGAVRPRGQLLFAPGRHGRRGAG